MILKPYIGSLQRWSLLTVVMLLTIAVDQDQSFTEGPVPVDAMNDWAVGHLENVETIHDWLRFEDSKVIDTAGEGVYNNFTLLWAAEM
jgi:hypothetical protein